MRDRIGLALLVALASFPALAQTDTTASKAGWFVSLHAGALFSEVGGTATISTQLFQGIHYNRFSLGVGVGYDTYDDWETLPVFTGIGYDVVRHGRNALYVQLNGGYSKSWSRIPDELSVGMQYDGGYFIHPMAGYRLQQGKIAFHLTCGYKIQRIQYRRSMGGWGWGLPMVTTVDQDMERLSVQLGIGLH